MVGMEVFDLAIIPQQETLGNYNLEYHDSFKRLIIPQQETLGNYNRWFQT